MCVAYDVDGVRHDEMPMTQTEFHHARPIYERLDGWWEDISGCRTFDDLPANAQAYVRALEEMSGTPHLGRRRRSRPRADTDRSALTCARQRRARSTPLDRRPATRVKQAPPGGRTLAP